ncbi:hypothetical protein IEQ34_020132 [Dendrobium chrysotoxum]|uniref:Uncharacterized protein n=1 Tax=Dendrobium chrysotoxum TaxID=161865 RepID=A0AAV7FZP9_DENCH|nr:hypothetical protein IEQ34_020132 [Dendrobium chrysotoxum]
MKQPPHRLVSIGKRIFEQENNEIPAKFPADIITPESMTALPADFSAGNFTAAFPTEIASVTFWQLNRRNCAGVFNIPTHIPPVISDGYSGGFTTGLIKTRRSITGG